MPVHPVSGAFVRVGRRECPKICKFPPLRGETASEAVSGEVRRLSASPGAGDYPPDFLAHEIGQFRAVRRKTAHPEPVRTGSRRWTTHGSTDDEAAARRPLPGEGDDAGRLQGRVPPAGSTSAPSPSRLRRHRPRTQRTPSTDCEDSVRSLMVLGSGLAAASVTLRQTGFVPFAGLVR